MGLNSEEKLIWEEEIVEFLGEYWTMEGRPDLFRDMIEHVLKVYPDDNFDMQVILGEAFEFLQTLCRDAVSSQDLEYMALADKERMIFNP